MIYDNGSNEKIKAKIELLVKELKDKAEELHGEVYFINGTINLGLPKAYNRSIKFLKDNKYEFVLILDQDSQIEQNTIEILMTEYKRLNGIFKIGAISPRVVQEDQGPLNPFFDGRFRWKNLDYEDDSVIESPFLINSGTFMQITTVEKVGFYDETLFLDSVDHDMSFRMRSIGLRLFVIKNLTLNQNVDNKIDFRFLWIRLDREGHSPTSDYYLVRDSLRVAQRYMKKYWPQSVLLGLNVIIKFIATFLIYQHKTERFAMLIKGLKDFVKSM